MKKIDGTIKQRAVLLLQSDQSIERVAKTLGLSSRTVGRIKKSTLPTLPSLPAGRPRILSERTLRDFNRKVLIGEYKAGKAVIKHLQQQGIKLSYQTALYNLR